ncbi:MAG: hypothetical protein AAF846_00995 [Chloroflexota bacterium]
MLYSFAQRLATIFGSVMILLFFSEYFFLNEGPVETVILGLDDPIGLLLMWVEFTLYYALFTYLFLIVIQQFEVKTRLNLLLAGAIFGWATEALIVPIVYEAVPISFIFPSISWHALVDVLLGWYLVRRVMRLNQPILSALMFVTLGVIWGFWATWFWVDPNLSPILPVDFTAFAIVTSGFWIVGMLLLDYAGTNNFRASRWEIGIILTITSILFIMMALTFLPFSLALPPVIALTVFALHRSKANDYPQNHLQILHTQRPAWWHYLLAVLTPLTASLVYPSLYENQLGVPTEDITVLLLIAGLVAFVVALIHPFTKQKSIDNTQEHNNEKSSNELSD